ncbi:hypothetical protein UNPF46_08595 [Bradyrhizobium sp. UNPF46]|uniref:hypothetical protein n=1 Tax=Bradyrhizobium sp. UNPF46 TaxID=1141168 RepID=UPI0011540B0B|nr:hypothetical protein [Bradyrhizobium sp. UNPF46]TQF41169.1 hypothetical protein UNPF46_08595 [Bradyrhizobium sp. UNPF46]
MTIENPDESEVIETPTPVEPESPENDDELDPEVAPVPPENETPEQLKSRLAETEERNRKLWARLQREKTKGKPATPAVPAPKPAEPAKPASLTRDEAILIAKGFSEEELEKAKKIAEVENIPLTEVPTNDLFITWKTKREAEKKEQDAQLGVGRGARRTVKRTFSTPGLSDSEHKEMFKEKIGR